MPHMAAGSCTGTAAFHLTPSQGAGGSCIERTTLLPPRAGDRCRVSLECLQWNQGQRLYATGAGSMQRPTQGTPAARIDHSPRPTAKPLMCQLYALAACAVGSACAALHSLFLRCGPNSTAYTAVSPGETTDSVCPLPLLPCSCCPLGDPCFAGCWG